MKKYMCFALVIAICFCSISISADEALVNIAPKSVVDVSSVYGGNLMPASNVTDGNDGTSWMNGYYPNGSNFFKINLGYPVNVSYLSILMVNDYNVNFEIRLSSGDPFVDYDVLHTYSGANVLAGRQELRLEGAMALKKYTSVLFVTRDANGPMGISDIKVFVPNSQTGLVNVALGKKTTGGTNAFGLSSAALVDGNINTISAIQSDPYYIDIDLGKRYAISHIELHTTKDENGGNRSGIRLYASNTEGFTDEADIILLKEFTDYMNGNTPYSFSVSGGKYRYIRFTSSVADFTPMNELSVFAKTDESFGRWKVISPTGEITSITNKEISEVSIEVANETGTAKKYILIAMICDEKGNIVFCRSKTQSIINKKNLVVSFSEYPVKLIPKEYSLKALLIGDFANMNLLCGDLRIEGNL